MMDSPGLINLLLEGSTANNNLMAAVITFALTVGLAYLFYPAIIVAASPSIEHKTEDLKTTRTTTTKEGQSDDDVLLSIIVPAFNEELRLPKMLQEAYSYLSSPSEAPKAGCCPALQMLSAALNKQSNKESTSSLAVEWIVVNDGSKDSTCQVYRDYVNKLPEVSPSNNSNDPNGRISMTWKLLSLTTNSGKGAAVREGMLAAGGSYRLMVDADGATDFGPGLEALAQHARAAPIVLGSRAKLHHDDDDDAAAAGSSAANNRSLVRRVLQLGFHVVKLALVGAADDIRDTQCGFKLFASRAAADVFGHLHLRRWAFDIEVVFLAKHLQYAMKEEEVPWQEIEGSKLNTSPLNLALVSVAMLRDMICVRLCYALGLWETTGRRRRK